MPRMQMYGTRLSREGRVVIPSAVRRALRLRTGDNMVWVLEGDELVLKRRRAVENELWEKFSEVRGSLAAELINERRREAKDEE